MPSSASAAFESYGMKLYKTRSHSGSGQTAPILQARFGLKRAPNGYRTLLQCPYCEKTWDTNYKLNRHILTHTGARPYECDICQRKFTQKSHMENHKVVHMDQEAFENPAITARPDEDSKGKHSF